MKTETAFTNKFVVKVEENRIELNEKTVKLFLKGENTEENEIEFTGYTMGKLNVAIFKKYRYQDKSMAQQLITQAKMVAWELGYDIFLSHDNDDTFPQCGFETFSQNKHNFYCAELSWNAFKKLAAKSINLNAIRLN